MIFKNQQNKLLLKYCLVSLLLVFSIIYSYKKPEMAFIYMCFYVLYIWFDITAAYYKGKGELEKWNNTTKEELRKTTNQ